MPRCDLLTVAMALTGIVQLERSSHLQTTHKLRVAELDLAQLRLDAAKRAVMDDKHGHK